MPGLLVSNMAAAMIAVPAFFGSALADPAVVHFPITKVNSDEEITDLRKRSTEAFSESLGNARNHYALTCSLGTPPQPFQLILDTGSSDLWVQSSSNPRCSIEQRCDPYSVFNSSASSTYSSNHTDFYILYGDGSSANGTWSQDTFTFGSNVKIDGFNFALSDYSTTDSPVAGIGLMDGESTAVLSDRTYNNLPVQLKQSGYISHIAYSLWLNSYDSPQGNLLFGGIDTGAFSGSLYTFPMVPVDTDVVDRLAITLNGLNLINADGNRTSQFLEAFPITLDSGSTLSALPGYELSGLMAGIGAPYIPEVSMYLMDCDKLATMKSGIGFDFSGVEYIVSFQDLAIPLAKNGSTLLCSPGFLEGDIAILGDNALRALYVVYDLENLEIGIAQANTGSSLTTAYQQISTGIPGTKAPFYTRIGGSVNTDRILPNATSTSDPFDDGDSHTDTYATSVETTLGQATKTGKIPMGYTGYSKDLASLGSSQTGSAPATATVTTSASASTKAKKNGAAVVSPKNSILAAAALGALLL